jgi:BatD DUF11 like domain
MARIMMRRIYLFFLFIVYTCVAQGQVTFIASASAPKIGIKDQVHVQYTVRDAQNLKTIEPGATPDFAIVGGPFQSQSSNISIVNGRAIQSNSITITYVLQPKHEGTFTIQPATAKDAAGHIYQSNALSIQVVAGSLAQQQRRQANPFGDDDDDPFAGLRQMQQQMQQIQQQMRQQQPNPAQQQQQQPQDPPVNQEEINKDLFIRVEVDKSKVKVGEQITATYKLYSRLYMQVNISKLPDLTGFWAQDFELPKQNKPVEEVLNGKKYQVFTLRKSALFPQQTGTLELDPAEAKGVARIVQQVKRRMRDMDPFGGGSLMMNDPFFNNALFNTTAYKDVPVNLKSEPVKIKVTALPDEGKPADFGGAVGNFDVSASLDKNDLTTDDVATLTLNVTGSGNIKLFAAPKLSLPNGLNTFDPLIADTITGRSTTISGTKKITYSITPRTPGDYDIAGIPFSFFNTKTGKYETVVSQPFKLHVKPGKHYNPAQTTGGNNTLAMKDIHDVNTKPLPELTFGSKPLLFSAGYWSMYTLQILAFAGMLVWKKREEEMSKDSVLLRKKRANKVALNRLVTAKKLLTENKASLFYEEISKAIWLYLSDKLNIPLSGLSKETATEAMVARRVAAELQSRLSDVIWDCETALYASGGSQKMNQTYETAIQVISDLEDVLKA